MDYALSKERLCLDAESSSTVLSRINMIVMGLPLAVQDELDREEISSIEKLFVELRRLDDSFSRMKADGTSNQRRSVTMEKPKDKIDTLATNRYYTPKKPCSICIRLGWSNRYHPERECRNKNLVETKKLININETYVDNSNNTCREIDSVKIIENDNNLN